MDELAPTRFLGKSEVLVERPCGFEVDAGNDVRRVDADAVQPRSVTGVAAMLGDEGPSSPFSAPTDQGRPRPYQEVTQSSCRLNNMGGPAFSSQTEAQIRNIDVRPVLIGLGTKEQLP